MTGQQALKFQELIHHQDYQQSPTDLLIQKKKNTLTLGGQGVFLVENAGTVLCSPTSFLPNLNLWLGSLLALGTDN